MPFRSRRDDGQFRLATAQGAVAVRPEGKFGPRLQDVCAPGQKRFHRQRERVVEDGRRRVRCGELCGRRVTLARSTKPLAGQRQEIGVASSELDVCEVIIVEHACPMEEIGRLAQEQAQVGGVDRNRVERQNWQAARLMVGHRLRCQYQRRQRNPSQESALQLQ